ncbi:MAG: NAD(P)H-binding protein [Bacteroidota bacterium]
MSQQDKMGTISILGAGWLGLPLGAALVRRGFAVKGSTTREEKRPLLEKEGLQAFLIRVEEELLMSPANEDFFRSDVLFINIPPGRRRPDVADAFPRQLKSIVDQAIGKGVQKIIFVSSTSVYASEGQMAREEDELAPETASGIALKRSEEYLQQQKVDWVILRLAGLVGGDRKAGRFFAGRKDIAGGLSPVNMVHRDDCIAVISQILLQQKWGQIFNVCADEHPSRSDFYTAQAHKQGFELPTFTANYKSHKIVSNEKVKRELQYTFLHPDPMAF